MVALSRRRLATFATACAFAFAWTTASPAQQKPKISVSSLTLPVFNPIVWNIMMKNNKVFFNPWETIHESNPQEILDREEKITLVPFLIMQGGLDDNVLPEVQEKFAKTYKAAGGDCDYRLFENSVHEWVAEPGPQTDKAVEVAKEFIVRQLKA